MRDETRCTHCGHILKSSEPKMAPIVQSATYVFDSTQEVGDVFDESIKALIYSRFANPTVMTAEQKIADLGDGIGAMRISSGQAAMLLAILNLCKVGDSFTSTPQTYGGTVNLSAATLKSYGIEYIFVDADADEETISAVVRENTRPIFDETIANPALSVLDIEEFARIVHSYKISLIMGNTFVTPILCKPFESGADIAVHSTSKYTDGHTAQVGGVIVDFGNFDRINGKLPEFTEPDESYHGITYAGNYGKAAYITRARMQLMRSYGAYPVVNSVFLLNLGLGTPAVRMERYCKNALEVTSYLAASNKIEKVIHPGLGSDKYYPLAKKYLKGTSGVISFTIEGGKDNVVKLMDGLKLASIEVHVAGIRACVLHPASATYRQPTEEQLYAVDVSPGMIRFPVGLESIGDIIEDIEQSLSKV